MSAINDGLGFVSAVVQGGDVQHGGSLSLHGLPLPQQTFGSGLEGGGGGGTHVKVLSNGLCSISLAIPELEIQSSKVELSNGLCSISLAIPELEI